MSSEWAKYLARGVAPQRRVLIGGNWKCNGTVAEVRTLVDRLNAAGAFPLSSEVFGIISTFPAFFLSFLIPNRKVVIAVPSIHLLGVKASIREDIAVAAQV